MTSPNEDGGPAFPRPMGNNGLEGYEDHRSNYEQAGMSLRDWYAGQALPVVIQIYAADNEAGLGVEHLPRNCALHAYAIADAMLAARKSNS